MQFVDNAIDVSILVDDNTCNEADRLDAFIKLVSTFVSGSQQIISTPKFCFSNFLGKKQENISIQFVFNNKFL